MDLHQVRRTVIDHLRTWQAILKAMRSNEEQTNSQYEDAVEGGYPEDIRAILQRGLSDERRHKAWLVATLREH